MFIRLSEYLKRVRRRVSLTAAKPLSQFHALASAIRAGGFDDAIQSELGINNNNSNIVEILDAVSNYLAKTMRGKPKGYFSKSIKETLYVIVRFEEEPDTEDFKRCICAFVQRRGSAELVQLLFQFYVFNSVWSELEDLLRESEGGQALEKIWNDLEGLCAAAVDDVVRDWHTPESASLLEPERARDMLVQIQDQLVQLSKPKLVLAKTSL